MSSLSGKAPIALTDMPEPLLEDGPVLVETLSIGICGTDLDIVNGDYGMAPPGEEWLVIGHESLGRVAEAPAETGFSAGDLVVGVVRRRDPVPCRACAAGHWDMCGYELAAGALAHADPGWLGSLITREVPIGDWAEAYIRRPDDIKAVLSFR